MITGHNTDVRHRSAVFHVQTEDKGTSNPFIETLVYVGGQVLGAKRASYADLLKEDKGEKAIISFMEQQHRWTIAAIQKGKFDEKLDALIGPQPVQEATAEVARVVDEEAEEDGDGSSQVSPPVGAAALPQTLDQVILDYLTTEADQEQLLLVVDSDTELFPGKRATLAIRTTSSKTGLPVTGARVAVKMISTDREAETLAEGKTAHGGKVQLTADLPALKQGTAALIIVADSTLGTAEIKHLL